jgi:hypothetical protein
MLLYSVRATSPIVGTSDALLGLPIAPGDILTPVGAGGGPPGILVPAEALGLGTMRSGALEDDDVDAIDVGEGPVKDCNMNGIEDVDDIAAGTSLDTNLNSIPDECEPPGSGDCFCSNAVAPCSNPDPVGGCANSTGAGASLTGTGSSSIVSDDLALTVSGTPLNQFGLIFMGPGSTSVALGAGVRCVDAGGVSLYRFPARPTGGSGGWTETGVAGFSCTTFPAPGCIAAGSTWNFQGWYRDPGGPCATSNLSNSWSVMFTP